MRKADFKSRIKKIEIINRVLAERWAQSIRVILEDIELSNENLLELKQFRPNEQVLVELSPVQVNLFEFGTKKPDALAGEPDSQELGGGAEAEELISFVEGDPPLKENERIEKRWQF